MAAGMNLEPWKAGRPVGAFAAKAMILCGMVALLTGCGATIVKPDSPPEDPVTVLLLDHGRHSSLVLPGPDDTAMTRYSYGDWSYYAEADMGWKSGFRALMWPTQATLGRRVLEGPPDETTVRSRVRVGIAEIIPLEVASREARSLQQALDAVYEEQLSTRLYNARFDLEFVEHPRDYSLSSNSNGMVAEWLRDLGLEVRGQPVWSRWRVQSGE